LPPGTKLNGRIESNLNAFKHGLAAYSETARGEITTEYEEGIRQQILNGLIADKSGDQQISTATRILAEVIASDACWLMVIMVPLIMSSRTIRRGIAEGLGVF
jgi:hypothetical protein